MTTFDEDSYKWSQEQAEFLKNKQWDKVDHIYAASVIRIDGQEGCFRLVGLLVLCIQCMLKLSLYPECIGEINKWDLIAKKCVSSMKNILGHSPSLLKEIEECLEEYYIEAQTMACIEQEDSLYSIERFPLKCPWTIDEILYTTQGE